METFFQGKITRFFSCAVNSIIVNKLFIINKQTAAIIRIYIKRVNTGFRNLYKSFKLKCKMLIFWRDLQIDPWNCFGFVWSKLWKIRQNSFWCDMYIVSKREKTILFEKTVLPQNQGGQYPESIRRHLTGWPHLYQFWFPGTKSRYVWSECAHPWYPVQ